MQKTPDTNSIKRRLIPLSEWDEFHPWPTVASLRFYHYHGATNGFVKHGVIKRVGRRLLVDEEAFFRWVDDQPGNQKRGGCSHE